MPITSQEALQIILNQPIDLSHELVSIDDALGRVLAEPICADRDFPPFNRVCMDGIAINFQCFNNGQSSFKIEGVQAAGGPQLSLQKTDHALEVMTGAVLPKHTDTVIPYELVAIENGMATIQTTDVHHFQHIHSQGKDHLKNDIIISGSKLITAADIGVMATVGKTQIAVKKNPKIAIISTGDELVDVHQKPLAHQIRKSNVHTISASLKTFGMQADLFHIPDDKQALKTQIANFLEQYDTLLFSGAVSKGKFDYLPEILDQLGVIKHFHRVQQRPGKPFWFGQKNSTTVFAFPGNPVSTFVCFHAYFLPWLKKSLSLTKKQLTAQLFEDVQFNPSLTYFLPIVLKIVDGKLVAKPEKGNGSGDLANLSQIDGLMVLPSHQSTFKAGEIFPIIPVNSIF